MKNTNLENRLSLVIGFLCLVIAFLLPCALKAQTTKTTSTHHTITADKLEIYAPCVQSNIIIKEIEGSRLIVETTVSINKSLNALEFLIMAGRYETTLYNTDNVSLHYTKLAVSNPIKDSIENISIILYVPKSVKLVTIKPLEL